MIAAPDVTQPPSLFLMIYAYLEDLVTLKLTPRQIVWWE